MQAEPVGVDRRSQQLDGDTLEQRSDSPIREHNIAPAVQHHRGVGLVAGEQVLEGVAGLLALLAA